MAKIRRARQDTIKRFSHYWGGTWMLYLMLVIPVVYFFIFKYVPMVNIAIAFKDYNMFQGVWSKGSPWVGWKYFIQAFHERDFWNALRNTLWLNFLDLLAGFPAPLILALVLNELSFTKFKKVTQTVVYLPHFLSWVIISSIAIKLLAPATGIVNIILKNNFGIEPINFLMDKVLWVGTFVVFGVWKEMGWGTIIYLAAITGINPELYEAAEVDGAGRWRKLWHITLPGIRPTIVILLILSIGNIVGGGFDRNYTMMNGLVLQVADNLATLVYRVGIKGFQFSLTAAIGLFQSVVCVIFLISANLFAGKFGERGIW